LIEEYENWEDSIRRTFIELADYMTKKCSKCTQELDASSFSRCSGGSYLRPECRKCGYELQKERVKIRKEQGDPSSDYKCPICLKNNEELKGVGGKRAKDCWTVDHDHETKKFRGYLCHNCNRAIGNFKDDIERLWRAIEYLSPKNEQKC
jgi:DNA-directed RNA polymerase subunit RPC12/RpoP